MERSTHSPASVNGSRFAAVLGSRFAAVTIGLGCAATVLLAGCTSGGRPLANTASESQASTPTSPTDAVPTAAASSDSATVVPTGTDPAPTPTQSGGASPSATAGTGTHAPKTADVIIVHAGWDSAQQAAVVRAYAPNVLASKATCTLRLTRDGTTRSASRTASRSASDMQCGSLTIPGSQLTNGDWTAVVEFTSPEASGTSKNQTITVTK